MELFFWIFLGLVAGGLLSLLTGTYKVQGVLTDSVLGAIGGIVGGLVLNIIAQREASGLNLYTILISSLGAVVLIWLGKMINTSSG